MDNGHQWTEMSTMSTTGPWPRVVRVVLGPVMGWLVRNANRRFAGDYSWYLVKDRIMRRVAFPDGADMQLLPPKPCWNCTVGIVHWRALSDGGPIYCRQCDGRGNYRPERLVQLLRFKLGSHVFHKPGDSVSNLAARLEDPEEADPVAAFRDGVAARWGAKERIEGLIRHDRNKHPDLGYWSRVVLELLFNTRHMLRVMRRHYPRVWKTWVLRKTYRLRERMGWLTEDELLPF